MITPLIMEGETNGARGRVLNKAHRYAYYKMAAKDILGLVNGLKLVLDCYVKNTAVEAKHCLNNSSFRPVVGYVCQSYENIWKETDYVLENIEFPGFPDDGFPLESQWKDSGTIPAQVVNMPPNNGIAGHRQLHTWCRAYHVRYCHSTSEDSEINRMKYKITNNQQVCIYRIAGYFCITEQLI